MRADGGEVGKEIARLLTAQGHRPSPPQPVAARRDAVPVDGEEGDGTVRVAYNRPASGFVRML